MTVTSALPVLSEASAKAAKPGDVIKDAKVPGLQLRCFPKRKVFYLYYRTKSGVQRKPSLGAYGKITIAQAREAAQTLLARVALGEDPSKDWAVARETKTLEDLWAKWRTRHGKAKKSEGEDKRLWEKNLEPWHKRRLDWFTYDNVASLHERITEEKGPITANRTLALLSTMFSFAVAPMEWMAKNPCEAVTRNRETKRRRYMTSEESLAVAEALRKKAAVSPNGVVFIYLLALTGARCGELAKARWKDFQGNKIVLKEHKTDGSDELRIIHLPPQAAALIDSLPRTSGTILTITSPRTLWESVRKDAGCPDLRLHDLRHSFASAALSSGLNLGQVGELLGHADPATTKRYAHLIEEKAQSAVAQTANAIGILGTGAP